VDHVERPAYAERLSGSLRIAGRIGAQQRKKGRRTIGVERRGRRFGAPLSPEDPIRQPLAVSSAQHLVTKLLLGCTGKPPGDRGTQHLVSRARQFKRDLHAPGRGAASRS
jgi:hypothetical protein